VVGQAAHLKDEDLKDHKVSSQHNVPDSIEGGRGTESKGVSCRFSLA
jgi:hypothetical protein